MNSNKKYKDISEENKRLLEENARLRKKIGELESQMQKEYEEQMMFNDMYKLKH